MSAQVAAVGDPEWTGEQVHVVDPLVSLPSSAHLVSHEQLPPPQSLRECVGVVHICTPTALHLQHVREAQRGHRQYVGGDL